MSVLGSIAALIADIEAKVTTNGANQNTGARVQESLKNIVETLDGLPHTPVGFPYYFSATTTPVGLLAGHLRLNAGQTELYIRKTDIVVVDRSAVLAALSAVSSS